MGPGGSSPKQRATGNPRKWEGVRIVLGILAVGLSASGIGGLLTCARCNCIFPITLIWIGAVFGALAWDLPRDRWSPWRKRRTPTRSYGA